MILKIKTKLILFIIIIYSANVIAQNNLPVREVERVFFQRMDTLCKVNFDAAIGEAYSAIYYKKNDTEIIKETKRTTLIKLMIIGIDSSLNNIDSIFLKRYKHYSISNSLPPIVDETDSVVVIMSGMHPTSLKNAVHRKIYEEQIAQENKDYEYLKNQHSIIYCYQFALDLLEKSVKEYFDNSIEDKILLYNIIRANLKNVEKQKEIIDKIDKIVLSKYKAKK